MEHDSFDKQMYLTNKKQKIFNVRKVPYRIFDHEKCTSTSITDLKPTYTPFQIKQQIQELLSSKTIKKPEQSNYQFAILSSATYKELQKKYNQLKEDYNKQKQRRLEELSLKDEQLIKCKAQKERIDAQRIKIIQRRDELRSKIEEIREKRYILRNQQMLRQEEYRLINMNYLRNMMIGIKYQNGMEIDLDSMTYQELLELEEKMGSVSKGLSAEQIQKLPRKMHMQNCPQELCSVCYQNAKINEELTILPCSHSFHTECIKEWLLKEKVCPMCKQQIMGKIELNTISKIESNAISKIESQTISKIESNTISEMGKMKSQIMKEMESDKKLEVSEQGLKLLSSETIFRKQEFGNSSQKIESRDEQEKVGEQSRQMSMEG